MHIDKGEIKLQFINRLRITKHGTRYITSDSILQIYTSMNCLGIRWYISQRRRWFKKRHFKKRLPYFNSKSWASLLLPTTELLHHYFSLYFGYYIYPYISFKCSNNKCNSTTTTGVTSPQ